MPKLLPEKNKWIKFVLVAILIINFSSFYIAFAEEKEKTNLEKQVEQQEGTIKGDIGDKVIPKDDFSVKDASNTIMNQEYNGFNAEQKKNTIKDWIVTCLVKSRTIVIYGYGVFVICISIYMASMGSRSLNRRRHGLLLLIGNTIFFLTYINVPLIIIYFSILQNHLTEISIHERAIELMNFARSNSVIVSILLAYLGVSKLIVSKNDLPKRLQGKYLLKAAVVVFFVLNTIPLAIGSII
ncbi:hypothetical protein OD350_29045 (plasmid) [Clostridium beijerinckii]|uniref:hypothetical protein n=1 Tax=Clostridium beijerinckii TaxID=1520 RepID=UPI00222685BB|nr:hypothetical protein [Clostridium beijerinckii]UYZ38936.1 hypothetical protein OD350_29045 [Clostridium beijerinckii]